MITSEFIIRVLTVKSKRNHEYQQSIRNREVRQIVYTDALPFRANSLPNSFPGAAIPEWKLYPSH
jgi:hypothetical protein